MSTDAPHYPPSVRPGAGTPLRRIVLGVFLGLLLHTLLWLVVGGLLAALFWSQVSDSLDDDGGTAGETTSLSSPCVDALDAGLDTTAACAGDDPAAVEAYRVQVGG